MKKAALNSGLLTILTVAYLVLYTALLFSLGAAGKQALPVTEHWIDGTMINAIQLPPWW